jgi:hypothetical protein
VANHTGFETRKGSTTGASVCFVRVDGIYIIYIYIYIYIFVICVYATNVHIYNNVYVYNNVRLETNRKRSGRIFELKI